MPKLAQRDAPLVGEETKVTVPVLTPRSLRCEGAPGFDKYDYSYKFTFLCSQNSLAVSCLGCLASSEGLTEVEVFLLTELSLSRKVKASLRYALMVALANISSNHEGSEFFLTERVRQFLLLLVFKSFRGARSAASNFRRLLRPPKKVRLTSDPETKRFVGVGYRDKGHLSFPHETPTLRSQIQTSVPFRCNEWPQEHAEVFNQGILPTSILFPKGPKEEEILRRTQRAWMDYWLTISGQP
jgi:hypothetical protein